MPSSDTLAANRPSIAVYGIYKNEQKHMERFLNSIQIADEIVLCDTGSDDGTNQIIKHYQKTHPHLNLKVYTIFVSPWRFDDARNASLSLVSPGIDLCISLDIDEYLPEGWKEYLLGKWEPDYTRYHHKYKTVWPNGSVSEHRHERIHVRTGYLWKLPVHEILEYHGQEKVKWLDDFWIYQEPDEQKSRSHYLPLLEQSVRERKDIWKSWCFLALEYSAAGRNGEALEALDKALQLEDSDKAYLYKLKHLIYKDQNEVQAALINLEQAILLMPHRREPLFQKALYLQQLGRNTEAYFTIKAGENLTEKIIDYHYNPAAWGAEFEQVKLELLKLAGKEGFNLA
jgi:glycosyltransferase involved in cell wall biosynthesis